MIVSARCLLASAVLYAVLRSTRAAPADAWRDVRERPEVGADPRRDRGRRAVPADHVRRARRPERADRGADLARVAVHRAARAVHPAQRVDRPPPGRRACCSASRASRWSSASSRVHSLKEFLGALAMIGAAFFYGLSSFVVKGRYGTLAAVQTSWISVTVAGLLTLPIGHRDDARAHARRSARSRRSWSLGVLGTALAFVIYYELINGHRARRAPRSSPTSRRASRCSTARSSSTRRSRSPRSSAWC